MDEPKVSVIIPVYNRAVLISETVQSVLSQTYNNFEVLVIDDGSTDETATVVSAFPAPVRLYSQPHRGMGGSYSRNRGIAEASGEFIAFLDSDDLWHSTKIEKQMEFLRNEPELSWVYCDSEAIDGSSGNFIYRDSIIHGAPSGNVLIQLFKKNFLHTSSMVVRKSVFDLVGDFWPSPKATDRDMWLKIASKYPIGNVPEVLVRYRIHQDRVTDNLSGEDSFTAGLAVINRALERDPDRLTPYKNRALAQLYINTGLLLAKHGNLKKARNYFKRSIQLQPTFFTSYPFLFSTFLSKERFDKVNSIRRLARKRRSLKKR